MGSSISIGVTFKYWVLRISFPKLSAVESMPSTAKKSAGTAARKISSGKYVFLAHGKTDKELKGTSN